LSKVPKIFQELDKFMRPPLNNSLQQNKKGSGEDIFLFGLIMQFLRRKLHKICKKQVTFMKE
jgi:hypothetical protein